MYAFLNVKLCNPTISLGHRPATVQLTKIPTGRHCTMNDHARFFNENRPTHGWCINFSVFCRPLKSHQQRQYFWMYTFSSRTLNLDLHKEVKCTEYLLILRLRTACGLILTKRTAYRSTTKKQHYLYCSHVNNTVCGMHRHHHHIKVLVFVFVNFRSQQSTFSL